jgi:hypothetical protein
MLVRNELVRVVVLSPDPVVTENSLEVAPVTVFLNRSTNSRGCPELLCWKLSYIVIRKTPVFRNMICPVTKSNTVPTLGSMFSAKPDISRHAVVMSGAANGVDGPRIPP